MKVGGSSATVYYAYAAAAEHGFGLRWAAQGFTYGLGPDPDDPVCVSIGCAPLPPIAGRLGRSISGTLEVRVYEAGEAQEPFQLHVGADRTVLRPWVPFISDINGFQQARQVGDSALLLISATEDVELTIRAEFLETAGGHSHISLPVPFEDIEVAVDRGVFIQMGAILDQPIAGFLAMAGDTAASFHDVSTVGGGLVLTFTAGTVGGLVNVIVETLIDATQYSDTLTVTIAVPNLIHADTSDVVNSVYFVGGVPDVHVQASNWYMTPDVAERVEAIASAYRSTHAAVVGGGLKYLQHNDASLIFGGTFSVTGLTGDLGDHPTVRQHYAHQLGLDVDLNWCMVTSAGDDNQANRVYGTTCPNSTDYVDFLLLRTIADAEGACAARHGISDEQPEGNHYHIRFTGRCPGA